MILGHPRDARHGYPRPFKLGNKIRKRLETAFFPVKCASWARVRTGSSTAVTLSPARGKRVIAGTYVLRALLGPGNLTSEIATHVALRTRASVLRGRERRAAAGDTSQCSACSTEPPRATAPYSLIGRGARRARDIVRQTEASSIRHCMSKFATPRRRQPFVYP